MRTLVAFFSAEGTTRQVARRLAEAIGADLFEIVPETPYTAADLKWTNPLARCNREKIGHKDVPVAGTVADMDGYDRIYVGFPIWYGSAPNVVNTFLKGYDLSGKQIAAFATSGGSAIGKTAEKLRPYASGAQILDARLVQPSDSAETLRAWADSLN